MKWHCLKIPVNLSIKRKDCEKAIKAFHPQIMQNFKAMRNKFIFYFLLCVIVLFVVACRHWPEPEPGEPAYTPPAPDPFNTSGDALYSIYRKGLITRHIARNGRLMETIGLKSIDNVSPESWKKRGNSIFVTYPDGSEQRINMNNARYSVENIPGGTGSKPHLWVPLLAPVKKPGYSQEIYHVISEDGDNPLYYGGMALATLSLEKIHGVSKNSIHYARRLVEFFLKSEMNGRNGYMIRKARPFNSGRNRNGERIIQGASAEELLGTMLGLMYYLKAEDPKYPLYHQAAALRDRILSKISRGTIDDHYEHPFMLSNNDPHYRVKHFEFPMYASKGVYHPGTLDIMEQLYISTLTLGSGTTRPESGGTIDSNFFDHAMFLTSMILVLDGNLREDKKEWFAEVFMRDVIKASKTAGPDISALQNNAYMAVVAQLVNKYLNDSRDSWRISTKLSDIWGGYGSNDWKKWINMRNDEVDIIFKPNSGNALLRWQHNLPLINISDGDTSSTSRIWKNHNPQKNIGDWFTWVRRNPHYRNSTWVWKKGMPGWLSFAASAWAEAGPSLNESEYQNSTAKKYNAEGYHEKELEAKGHRDNQVEGAGLGLLFLRMLLTQINPERYPAPMLTEDKWYQTLPFNGVEPMSPMSFEYAYSFSSKYGNNQFEIKGDVEDALRIVKQGGDSSGTEKRFLVTYANKDEKLVLARGHITEEYHAPSGTITPEGIYIDASRTWKRFDKVAIAGTENRQYYVVAERAEQNTNLPNKDHWLRISLWDSKLSELDRWVNPSRHNKAVRQLDMNIMGDKYIVVMFRSVRNKNRIRMFKIDFTNKKIKDINVATFANGDEISNGRVRITTAYKNIIITSAQKGNRFGLYSKRWTGSYLENRGVSSLTTGTLLDITTVRKLDYSEADNVSKYYAVAAINKNGYLTVMSWEINPDGRLKYRGEFNSRDGENYLVGREANYNRASISSSYYRFKPGFVIAGKGVALEIRDKKGVWRKTKRGLKVVHGMIMDDGRPSIVSSQPLGSGDESAMRMLDVSGNVTDGRIGGFLTAHKTKDDHLVLSFWKNKDFE